MGGSVEVEGARPPEKIGEREARLGGPRARAAAEGGGLREPDVVGRGRSAEGGTAGGGMSEDAVWLLLVEDRAVEGREDT